jgi:hypothetical protein
VNELLNHLEGYFCIEVGGPHEYQRANCRLARRILGAFIFATLAKRINKHSHSRYRPCVIADRRRIAESGLPPRVLDGCKPLNGCAESAEICIRDSHGHCRPEPHFHPSTLSARLLRNLLQCPRQGVKGIPDGLDSFCVVKVLRLEPLRVTDDIVRIHHGVIEGLVRFIFTHVGTLSAAHSSMLASSSISSVATIISKLIANAAKAIAAIAHVTDPGPDAKPLSWTPITTRISPTREDATPHTMILRTQMRRRRFKVIERRSRTRASRTIGKTPARTEQVAEFTGPSLSAVKR